jgi:hypothetical protein
MLAVVLASILSSAVQAGGKGGCDGCGCNDGCGAVATLVKTTKKIEVTCFACQDDAVVLPGKNCRGDRNCEMACEACGGSGLLGAGILCGGCGGKGSCGGKGHGGSSHKGGDCGCGGKGCVCHMSTSENLVGPSKYFVWFNWTPGCATTRCVKRLVRRTVTKEVPSYEWVIQDLCKGCSDKADQVDPGVIAPGSAVPPPPPVEARLRYRNPHNVPISFDRAKNVTLMIRMPKEFVNAVK